MQIKSIALMVVASCVIGLSTGCVKKSDYEAMQQKLTTERDGVATELTNTVSQLNAEKQKVSDTQNKLLESTSANNQLKKDNKDLQASLDEANGKVTSLQSELSSTKDSLQSAQDKLADTEAERAKLESQVQKVKDSVNKLLSNLVASGKLDAKAIGFDKSTTSSTSTGGADTSSKSASQVLDMMGNM